MSFINMTMSTIPKRTITIILMVSILLAENESVFHEITKQYIYILYYIL